MFLRGFRDIRDNALIPHIIRGSFRKRGIYPFYPDLVVKPLSDREEREFIPLRGFDMIDSDEGRGARPIYLAPRNRYHQRLHLAQLSYLIRHAA